MNNEELIKNQFPNDEFLRSAVSQIVDKCTAELEATNKKISDECHKLVDSLEKKQNENKELTDKVKELETQIEKMKCCENCAWWYKLPNGQRDCAETCENLDNWSLRR